jgi:hypothetical protein
VRHLLEFQPVREPNGSKYRTISFTLRAQMPRSVLVARALINRNAVRRSRTHPI